MARNFLIVTQSEVDKRIAENIKSRELELSSYDFERENHEIAIQNLGHLEWDESTEKYKGLGRDAMIVRAMEDGLDSDAIQKISDLNSLELHRLNLEAVKSEIAKSERHYDNLIESLPEGERRDKAFASIQNEQ